MLTGHSGAQVNQANAGNGGGSLVRIFGVAFFGIAALTAYVPTQFWTEEDFTWGPGAITLVAFTLLFVHVLLVWRRTLPLDPALWLPIGVIFFYFGVPIAVEGIGGKEFDYDPWKIGAAYNLARGYCGALLALASYLAGMHLAGVRDLSKVTARVSLDQSLALPSMLLTVGALAMLAVGVALVGPSVVFGTYEQWWDAKAAGADPRFVDMGIVFAQAGMFGLVASYHPKRRYRLYLAGFVALILAYVAIQKGARASLMATGVGLVWCYSQRVKRLNPALITALVFAGVLVFPILGEYRNTKHFTGIERKSVESLLGDAMTDMGSTVNTLLYTMDLVPLTESYAKGIGYLESTYQLIPNVGLTPVRDDRLTSGLKAFHSNWLVWQVSPLWAAAGGSYGSSMAGELYFNFGVTGILLGCALIGYLSGWLRSSAQESSLRLTASALYFGCMIIYIRNPIGVPLKNLVWSVAALLIIRGLLSLLTSRSASPQVGRPVPL